MKASSIVRIAVSGTLCAACALVWIFCLSGCSPASLFATTAVTVNDTEISEKTITDYVQSFRESQNLSDEKSWGEWMAKTKTDPSRVRQEVMEYYVQQELMTQAAKENGIDITDEDIDAKVDAMKANYSSDKAWEDALKSAGTTEELYRESLRSAMVRTQLEEAVASDGIEPTDDEVLESARQVSTGLDGAKRSSHILFASDDTETAQQVLDQINAGTLSFEEAAKQYSIDTASAQNGGDVGWDKINSFVAPYTEALEGLQTNQMSGLVTSDFGIHIIKCTDAYYAPDQLTDLSQMPDEFVDMIRTTLRQSKMKTAWETWFAAYKESATITYADMPKNLPYDVDMSKYTSETGDMGAVPTEQSGTAPILQTSSQ